MLRKKNPEFSEEDRGEATSFFVSGVAAGAGVVSAASGQVLATASKAGGVLR